MVDTLTKTNTGSTLPSRYDPGIRNLVHDIKGGMAVGKILTRIDANPHHLGLLKRKEIKGILKRDGEFSEKYNLIKGFLDSGRQINVDLFMILLDSVGNNISNLAKVRLLFEQYGVSDNHRSELFLIKYDFLNNDYESSKFRIDQLNLRNGFEGLFPRRESSEMRIDMIAIYIMFNTDVGMKRENMITEIIQNGKAMVEKVRSKIQTLENR